MRKRRGVAGVKLKLKKLIGAVVLTWSQITGGKCFEIAAKLNAEIYEKWKYAADTYMNDPTVDNLNHLKLTEYVAKRIAKERITHPRGKMYIKRLMKWTMNIEVR